MLGKNVLNAEAQQAIRSALAPSISTLRKLARYKLEPSLERRLDALGERKEFLGREEQKELLALVAFAQRRTIEKLEAKVALKRLHELLSRMAADK